MKLPPITAAPWTLEDISHRHNGTRFRVVSETPSQCVQKWRQKNSGKSEYFSQTTICELHISWNGSGPEFGPKMLLGKDELSANSKAVRAVPDLLAALNLAWEFLEDLRTSNPGWLRGLVLQDYGRLNRLGEIPAALKAAGCTEEEEDGEAVSPERKLKFGFKMAKWLDDLDAIHAKARNRSVK